MASSWFFILQVNLSLCLTKGCAVKTYGGDGTQNHLLFNRNKRGSKLVSRMPRPLYPLRLAGPQIYDSSENRGWGREVMPRDRTPVRSLVSEAVLELTLCRHY